MVGNSPEIQHVRDLIDRVADGDATVLIRGETGTGKELVARALHERGGREQRPFLKTHLAALPDALLESELFGYERGAFTGAAARKPGRVELAQHGTLFLDEIGELSPSVQGKLLRLIQDREYERLGGTRALAADVRFVAATHRNLERMVETGEFREDLFYRLNVVSIWLPPLRARRDDIPLLVESHASKLAGIGRRGAVEFDPSALALLRAQRWPGNVRQLLNFVERLVVLVPGSVIRESDVRRELDELTMHCSPWMEATTNEGDANPRSEPRPDGPCTVRPLREEILRVERHSLMKALAAAEGNRTVAAGLLGVSRRTLYTKLEEHGLDDPSPVGNFGRGHRRERRLRAANGSSRHD